MSDGGIKPLPCPFAHDEQHEVLVEHDKGAETYHAECYYCGARGPYSDSHGGALAAWDRRAPAAYPAALVEQIAKALRDIAETSADEDDSCIYCGAQPASDHNSVCAAGIAHGALAALRAAGSAMGETAKPTCAPCSIPKPTGAPCTSCMRDAFGEEYQRNPDCPNCAKGKQMQHAEKLVLYSTSSPRR